MIIYKITNKINGKCYIGQSNYSFNKRYSAGKWWYHTSNQPLKRAAKKYGKNNFIVEILEENLLDQDELNKMELFHAEKHNAYTPYGYNIRLCGKNRKMFPEEIAYLRKFRLKKFKLRKVETWEILEIDDLPTFCKENGLYYATIKNIIGKTGSTIISKGYCSVDRSREEIDKRIEVKNKHFSNKPVTIFDSEGNSFYLKNPKEFAKSKNLGLGLFYKMITGKLFSYKGYSLIKYSKQESESFSLCFNFGEVKTFNSKKECAETVNIHETSVYKLLSGRLLICSGWHLPSTTKDMVWKNKKKKISIELLDPNGNLHKVENLKRFCEENNLSYKDFCYMIRGKFHVLKGWTKAKDSHLFTTLISPTGEKYRTTLLAKFCREHNLSLSQISKLSKPTSKSKHLHKGWLAYRGLD